MADESKKDENQQKNSQNASENNTNETNSTNETKNSNNKAQNKETAQNAENASQPNENSSQTPPDEPQDDEDLATLNEPSKKKRKKSFWIAMTSMVSGVIVAAMVGIVVYAFTASSAPKPTTSEGIEATISQGVVSGATVTKNDSSQVMQQIVYSASESDTSDNSSTWTGLTVVIEAPTDGSTTASATISFSIKNNSTSEPLQATLTSSVKSATNATMSTSLGGENKTSATLSAGEEISVQITFTITNTSYNAEISGFSVIVDLLNEEDAASATAFTQYLVA